ncbi:MULTISPECIES: SIMPL domain-containing protein [unclassified Flavobacterium]|uniref:SIMPL domain-containing protein n=1 Tax=unclassified Flavobacterium TaxID=196869 RepID=UPI001F13E002|nr:MULTISPECIES: SIMPL domain-containing protein [unclassified Flavobacterium]UMY65325.1 SIMPL domain-containing protein [Flavobacterium sp. HJ-32-4]
MKKIFLMTVLLAGASAWAQLPPPVPQQPALITVNGEGKVKVAPDQVSINVSIETKGSKAADVKKENDSRTDAVVKYIRKAGIADADFRTQRVTLNDEYDYEKKKHNYVATQTIRILIRDLTKYDGLMEGLVDQGVNNIYGIEFASSKAETLKSEARKKAIEDARKKALDFTSALGQQLGSAFTVTDNSPVDYPRPMYEMRAMAMAKDAMGGNDTLAAGEIEISAVVSVSFILK